MTLLVHRLPLATSKLAGRFNPPSYLDTRINVYGYLVRMDTCVLLIDTGIGAGNALIDQRFEPARSSISELLAAFGLEIGDVDVLVNSHLHFDHCGNNGLFPHADVFVQERELATARALGTRYTVPAWFDSPEARIHAVDGDMQICDGVSLLATPGHTPGHQSVLLESSQRRLLVAAQASFTADEFVRGGDPEAQAHEGLKQPYLESIARLKGLRADEIYFSHDAQVLI